MRRVYVRLRPAELEALRRRAEAERRHPADEAALLLADALRRREVEQGDRPAEPERGEAMARC